MAYCRISAQTIITVSDHRNLRAVWKLYENTPYAMLIGTFHCKAPLTVAQLRRIPAALRERLTVG